MTSKASLKSQAKENEEGYKKGQENSKKDEASSKRNSNASDASDSAAVSTDGKMRKADEVPEVRLSGDDDISAAVFVAKPDEESKVRRASSGIFWRDLSVTVKWGYILFVFANTFPIHSCSQGNVRATKKGNSQHCFRLLPP